MKNAYRVLSFVLLSSSLAMLRAGEAQPIDFDGPYQTSLQKSGKPDALQKELSGVMASFPDVIINILTSYFFYKKDNNITLHIDKHARNIIKQHTSYSVPIIHAGESTILGNELLTSVERTTGIPRTTFMLQEWAYQKSPHDEEERYAEGRAVTVSTTYPITTFDRYTFGIDIPNGKEWEAREKLAKPALKNKKQFKRKIRPACIVACN